MKIQETLLKIQQELVAPKGQYNSFGKYNYRSTEDILTGLKPHLKELKATVLVSDELVNIGERYYVKATASLVQGEEQISTTAFAREPLDQKGMNEAQITGSASSYARKYALNGLFAIDDTKDSDHETAVPEKKVVPNYKKLLEDCESLPELTKVGEGIPKEAWTKELIALATDLKKQMGS